MAGDPAREQGCVMDGHPRYLFFGCAKLLGSCEDIEAKGVHVLDADRICERAFCTGVTAFVPRFQGRRVCCKVVFEKRIAEGKCLRGRGRMIFLKGCEDNLWRNESFEEIETMGLQDVHIVPKDPGRNRLQIGCSESPVVIEIQAIQNSLGFFCVERVVAMASLMIAPSRATFDSIEMSPI